MIEKQLLRKYIRQEKKMRSSDELQIQSNQLMSLLEMNTRFQKAHVVLLYSALPDEPQTLSYLPTWCKEKQILLPVVNGDSLVIRSFQSLQDLKEGPFGILEPQGPAFTRYEEIDLVIVPGMAFDCQGNRLGRGKGYYDKLLSATTLRNTYKIGICFDFQLVDHVPVESNDIAMNEILCTHCD